MKYIAFLLTAFAFASCHNVGDDTPENLSPEDFMDVSVESLYSMKIPDYMSDSPQLNEEASLAYMHVFKEAYIMVIHEEKAEFQEVFRSLGQYDENKSPAENYCDIQMSYTKLDLDVVAESTPITTKISGCSAQRATLDGHSKAADTDIAYTLAFIEGETNMYMIMAWTLLNRKNGYAQTFDKCISSFTLLN